MDALVQAPALSLVFDIPLLSSPAAACKLDRVLVFDGSQRLRPRGHARRGVGSAPSKCHHCCARPADDPRLSSASRLFCNEGLPLEEPLGRSGTVPQASASASCPRPLQLILYEPFQRTLRTYLAWNHLFLRLGELVPACHPSTTIRPRNDLRVMDLAARGRPRIGRDEGS